MARLLGVALVVLLGACARPAAVPPVDAAVVSAPADLPATAPLAAEEAAVSTQPLPEAVETVAGAVQEPVREAVAALSDLAPPVAPPAPPEPAEAACRRAAASLIVRWEVSSEAFYNKRLRYPIWPGGASGITWGIGYDGGHQTADVILDDWQLHAERSALSTTAGFAGKRAKSVLPAYRHIATPFTYAADVFRDRSLIEYERRAKRAFRDGFDQLRPNACASILSLVYNRGTSTVGDSRREVKTLQKVCIPKEDYACIAEQLRSMTRLWRGTVNEKGLTARREAEAMLALTP